MAPVPINAWVLALLNVTNAEAKASTQLGESK